MKTLNEDLYNINENEYLAQQESILEDAIEMGLTEDEFNLICNDSHKFTHWIKIFIFPVLLLAYFICEINNFSLNNLSLRSFLAWNSNWMG